MALNIDVELRLGGIAIINLEGNLDEGTASDLEEKVKKNIDTGNVKIVLNLAKLEFMSSAGWGKLVELKSEASGKGGDLLLVAMQPAVQRIHELMGLKAMLSAYNSTTEAMVNFR